MDYSEWFSKRITELRLQKGVSARDMSLSLGQSESYINKIENKRTFPSMIGFFYICEYFEITPTDFFNTEYHSTGYSEKLRDEFMRLSPNNAQHILELVKALNSK